MALFSRRPKPSEEPERDAAASAAPEATPEAPAENVPHVPISVSTFGENRTPDAAPALPEGVSAMAAARPPHLASPAAEASKDLETVPGLRDNVLLRDALAALPEKAQPIELMNVARQLLQGHVYIRVQGDARELLAKGDNLPTSVITYQEQKYMLVYSSGRALQDAVRADGDASTSALAQPVISLLRQIVAGEFGGIAVDHASRPGSAILPKPLIEKALADLDPHLAVKTLLAADRTDETAGDIADALTYAPVWVAARRGEGDRIGIAELRTTEGERILELFSHPLELVALGRGDQPAKVTPEQLARALRSDDGISGVIVNPAGPWIRLSRAQLAPVLALGA
ncbi:SseB family protein [Microbacterium sp. Clip185]|uniref:SseB family protein n=1 Tax=Microbacterium sp. Clip185 TaxID=3025663 RepID=UPI0023670CBA|nr:SseB family protein [Microbacterium sp. Clip185]WDG18831.1 SseB family protein [Microbacterium sp. Clip185]